MLLSAELPPQPFLPLESISLFHCLRIRGRQMRDYLLGVSRGLDSGRDSEPSAFYHLTGSFLFFDYLGRFVLFIFLCVCVHLCAVPTDTGRGLGPVETELQAVVSPLHGCWEPNSGPYKCNTCSNRLSCLSCSYIKVSICLKSEWRFEQPSDAGQWN